MKDEKGGFIYFVGKLFFVAVLFAIALFLFKIAPYYEPKETFEKSDIRVVFNNKDITNSIPHKAYVENDVIMLSAETIMDNIKDIFVYYDKKYDTAIITSQVDVAKIKLGENKIDINGETKDLVGTAEMKKIHKEPKSGETSGDAYEDVLYIPISSIEDITKVNVNFNEKIIMTDIEGWNQIQIVKASSDEKLKLYKKFFSKTMGKVKTGEELYIFNNSGDDYVTARNIRGDIGYIPVEKIQDWSKIEHKNEFEIFENKNKLNKKVSLTWTYAGSASNMGNKIDGLDIISPTWLHLTKDLTLRTTISTNYLNWAKSQGYIVWPTLKNDGLELEDTSAFVTDMKRREEFINKVTKCAIENNLEGINIDFEYMLKEDVNEFSEFVRELAANLRRNNIIVSIDVVIPGGSDNYSLCFDRRALSKVVDYMMLMTYDQYGVGDVGTQKNGPTASLDWVENNVKTMLNYIGVPKEKLILCVPFYYRKWLVDKNTGITKSTSAAYIKGGQEELLKYKDIAVWHEDEGQYYIEFEEGSNIRKIWLENNDSLKLKVDLVNKYDLAGVASWMWGYEDESAWNTINKTLKR